MKIEIAYILLINDSNLTCLLERYTMKDLPHREKKQYKTRRK